MDSGRMGGGGGGGGSFGRDGSGMVMLQASLVPGRLGTRLACSQVCSTKGIGANGDGRQRQGVAPAADVLFITKLVVATGNKVLYPCTVHCKAFTHYAHLLTTWGFVTFPTSVVINPHATTVPCTILIQLLKFSVE